MSGFNTLINIFICEDSIDGIFTAIYGMGRRNKSYRYKLYF